MYIPVEGSLKKKIRVWIGRTDIVDEATKFKWISAWYEMNTKVYEKRGKQDPNAEDWLKQTLINLRREFNENLTCEEFFKIYDKIGLRDILTLEQYDDFSKRHTWYTMNDMDIMEAAFWELFLEYLGRWR